MDSKTVILKKEQRVERFKKVRLRVKNGIRKC